MGIPRVEKFVSVTGCPDANVASSFDGANLDRSTTYGTTLPVVPYVVMLSSYILLSNHLLTYSGLQSPSARRILSIDLAIVVIAAMFLGWLRFTDTFTLFLLQPIVRLCVNVFVSVNVICFVPPRRIAPGQVLVGWMLYLSLFTALGTYVIASTHNNPAFDNSIYLSDGTFQGFSFWGFVFLKYYATRNSSLFLFATVFRYSMLTATLAIAYLVYRRKVPLREASR